MTINRPPVYMLQTIPRSTSAIAPKYRRPTSLALLCLFAGSVAPGQTQAPPNLGTVVKVSATPELSKYWQIREAGLTEELAVTHGYVVLQNVSGRTLHRSALYAEYFDTSGRLCFSMTFSLAKNIINRAPVVPGGTRTLYSANIGLLPAARPTAARIYLLRDGEADQTQQTTDEPSVRAPATLSGSIPAADSTLQLPSQIASEKGPFVDLVLAMIILNESGQITQTRIINAASPSLETWFLNFAPKLSFYPATHSNVPVASVVLIDVKAMLSREASADSLLPASDVPWVKQFAGQLAAGEIPPVTEIVFGPPGKIQLPGSSEYIEGPPSPPGMLELMTLLSDWSNPCYEWARDKSMPQHRARKLAEDTPR